MVNETLTDASRADVFVTVFYGIFDRRDGRLRYSNGGHNPPVLVAPGQAELLPLTGGVALAMFDGLTYGDGEVTVPPSGKLFLYTDGVPESTNVHEEEFGYDRMRENLLSSADRSPSDTIETMLRRVEAFAGAAPQFDDIAMLVLSREQAADRIVVHRFSLRNDLAEIPRATGELAEFAKRGGIDAADTRKLQMALADVLTTTIDYRLPAGSTYEIAVRALLEDGTVEVAVDDDGAPYELVDPPSDIDPEERYVSQAGGKIVRPMQMDDVDSATVGGHNRLIMRKRVVA
jgi:anti-sigma regulatory factor (Ser/Thr protein kinase)